MTGKIRPSSEGFTERLEEKRLDAGWLGKLFGSSKYAPFNIAGIVLILIVVIGAYCLYAPPEKTSALEVWKVLAPIITMILGYLFGRRNDD